MKGSLLVIGRGREKNFIGKIIRKKCLDFSSFIVEMIYNKIL